MTEELKIAMIAINKWMFHGWNYESVPLTIKTPYGTTDTVNVPQFIKEIKWTCNTSHMLEKWNKATRTQDPDTFMGDKELYPTMDYNSNVVHKWEVKLRHREDIGELRGTYSYAKLMNILKSNPNG